MEPDRPVVVICGKIHQAGLDILQAHATVVTPEESTEPGIIGVGHEAQALLVRTNPPITERLMASLKKLKCVARHGVGVDNVDLAAATRLGVPVLHAPGQNADAATEHTILLMLAVTKKLIALDTQTRKGDWAPDRYSGIGDLHGQTLGVIGVGNIGRRVAHIATALGMEVLGYDPYMRPEELKRRGASPIAKLPMLLKRADVVTLHTPLTPETLHLVNRKTIAGMKDGAILINTSRGRVVDEQALYSALVSKKLVAAGLDVWEEEPTPVTNPLLSLPNVVCTPHVAGVSERAQRNIATCVCNEIVRVLRGERPLVVANPEVWPKLSHLK